MFFDAAKPFVLENAKDNAVSPRAVEVFHIASQNSFDGAADAFHRVDTAAVEIVGPKLYPLHLHLFERIRQQQEFAMLVETGSVELLAVPSIAKLQGLVGKLDVVKPRTPGVNLVALVKNYKREFGLLVAVFGRNPDVIRKIFASLRRNR